MSFKSPLIVVVGLVVSVAAGAQTPGYPSDGSQPYSPPPPGYPPQPAYPPPGPPPGPPGAAYPAPAYGAPAYPPPGYVAPSYTTLAGQPVIGPYGLTYVSGVPAYFVDGAYLPLVFVAGYGWGYYGVGNRFFPAPGFLRARLDRFYPNGRGFPGRGDFHGRPGFRGGPSDRDEGDRRDFRDRR